MSHNSVNNDEDIISQEFLGMYDPPQACALTVELDLVLKLLF